jgi:hypothetical protein
MIYGKSGSKQGAELSRFLAEQLTGAGKIFSDQQLQTIKTAVVESTKALDEGDTLTAVKRLQALKKLGTPGNLGSYAGAALEADALHGKLVEQGRAALKSAHEKLSAGETFPGVLGIVSANRVYGLVPELRSDLASAQRDLGKNAQLKDFLRQAEALDRALALAEQKGAGPRKQAITALSQVIARFPESPAAENAQAKLGELGAEPVSITTAAAERPMSLRTWTDTTGKFSVEAEFAALDGNNVKLKRKDGSVLSVPLDKLSNQDRAFVSDAMKNGAAEK